MWRSLRGGSQWFLPSATSADVGDSAWNERLTVAVAVSLFVQNAGDLAVDVILGELANASDGSRWRRLRVAHRPPHAMTRNHTRPPPNRHVDAPGDVDVTKRHVFDEKPYDLLSLTVARRRCPPKPGQVLGQGEDLLALLGRKLEGRLAPGLGVTPLELVDLCQSLVPLALERARYKPVLGLHLVVTPRCFLGLVARPSIRFCHWLSHAASR